MCRVVDSQMQSIDLRATVRIKVTVGVVSTLRVNRSVPSEAPARGLRKGGVYGMEDGQVQGINARTVVGVRVLVDVCAALGVSRSMPSIILADGEAFSIMGAVMDGQMQRHSAVSPVNVLIPTRVIAGLRVGLAIPIVTLTRRGRELVGRGVVHGEVEGIDLRAAVAVGVRMVVGARGVVGLPVTVGPSVGVVGGDGLGTVGRVVDGQVQGDDAVAALSVGQGEGRGGGALGVGHAVDPGEASAGHLRVGTRRRVVDGQMQGVGAGTSLGVGVVVGVDTGSGVRGAVPCVAVAGGDVLGIVGAVVNRQVQGNDTVRAVDVVVGPHVVSGLGVRPAVPSVAFAGGGGELVRRGVVHGKVEGIDLGTAVAVGVRIVVGTRLRVGFAVAVRPRIAVVGRLGEPKIRRIVNRQVEGIDLRAPIRILVDIGVVARGGVGCTIPSITFASRLGKRQVGRIVDGQMQGIDLRAAVGVLVGVGVGSGGDIGLPVTVHPSVAATFRNGDGVVCRVVDGQMQGVNLCAPVGIGVTVSIVAGDRIGLAVATRPGVAATCGRFDKFRFRVVDTQMQGQCTVTTRHRGVLESIITRLRIGNTLKNDRITSRYRGIFVMGDEHVHRHNRVKGTAVRAVKMQSAIDDRIVWKVSGR